MLQGRDGVVVVCLDRPGQAARTGRVYGMEDVSRDSEPTRPYALEYDAQPALCLYALPGQDKAKIEKYMDSSVPQCLRG